MKSRGMKRKWIGGVSVLAASLLVTSMPKSAAALPVGIGTNNFIGVPAALQENYLGPNYVAPNQGVGSAGQMPGQFESVRLDASGNIIGINIAQPGVLLPGLAGVDPRANVPNFLLEHPVLGPAVPYWGARVGAVAELDENTTFNETLVEGSTTVIAYNFTPSFTTVVGAPLFNPDDGGGPGSVAGDFIPDFAPFSTDFAGNVFPALVGDSVTFTVLYSGARSDPTPGFFTPRVELYEGGVPFDLDGGAAALLDEADFDHSTGAAGGTLAGAVDGTLQLGGFVQSGPTATLTFTAFSTVGGSEVDAILLDVGFSGGTLVYTEGQLIDQGLVTAGSTGSFGMSMNQLLFIEDPEGFDSNLSQFDFLVLNPGESASANISLTVQPPTIPEPVTASLGGLGLAAVAGYLSSRRRVQR